MVKPVASWDDVLALARALPDVELGSYYGDLAPKVNGKAFVSPSREAGSFHVRCRHEDKAFLMETDPDTFWQTAHFANWPGLLVRYGSTDPERVALVIHRAWWDLAKASQRKVYGPRP